MLRRFRLQPQVFTALEAGIIGLFFIQALRLLVGLVYSRVAGATALSALDPAMIPPGTAIPADLNTVNNELTFLGYMLALPALAVLIGHIRWTIPIAVILVAAGRALMAVNLPTFTVTSAAALTVGAGVYYIAVLARHRANALPYFFVLGFAADQVFRAFGNTFDPSWSPAYLDIQQFLSVIVVIYSVIMVLWEIRRERRDDIEVDPTLTPDVGLLPLWSGLAIGAGLFVELSLLSLPNAIAGRGDLDYTTIAPLVILATLLPIIPAVRGQLRTFIGTFDGSTRGWLWLLITVLMIIVGLRVGGLGYTLIFAQFFISASWWWLTRPKTRRERSFGGLWLIGGILLFGALVAADNFTYEYAFVRDLGGDLRFLNDVIPPMLRAFRGMGLGVLLLAVFLTLLPMINTRRRIPWNGGKPLGSVFTLIGIAAVVGIVIYAVRPPVVQPIRNVDELRIATYNIHSGFSEFYAYDLNEIARVIQQSGANVVLMQEIEAGRLTSFGVDQPLWLARRLNMDRRFYPTNEGLHGLAVLSNVPIAFDDGALLPSTGQQTGVQRVQITPTADLTITIYNTALSPLLATSEGTEPQEQDQQQQLNALFRVVASHHPNGVLGPTVIGGTFFNVPDSDLLQQMRVANFQDPFAGYALELGATFSRVGLPRARFDYLWLRNLSPGGVNVDPSPASDHRLAVTGVFLNR